MNSIHGSNLIMQSNADLLFALLLTQQQKRSSK